MPRTRTAQQLGVAALTVSLLLLLAVTGAASLPATLAAALLAGAGHGLAFSGVARAVDARTPAGQRAGIGAALYLLFYLGSGTPAVAVGLMTTRMPLTAAVTRLSWAGVALGVLALLATCCLAVSVRRGSRQISHPDQAPIASSSTVVAQHEGRGHPRPHGSTPYAPAGGVPVTVLFTDTTAPDGSTRVPVAPHTE